MGRHCGTCTCKDLMDAHALLEILSRKDGPHREVYRGDRSTRWFVTHEGGGEVHPEAVRQLVESGQIVPVYDTAPADCFHVGKTLDMNATQKARRGKTRKDGRVDVYTDGSRETKSW